MRTITLLAITFWLSNSQTIFATSANELAKEVIRQESVTAHNVLDDSPEELVRATAANSRLSLQWAMLNDESISEAVRICYAIRIIDEQLGLHRIREVKKLTPQEELLMKKRLLLATGLLQLNNPKKPNKSEQATPRKPSD